MNQMAEMNEAVGIKNRYKMNGGGKQLVCPFKIQEFWKCIGFILLEVTYGKKGHKLWSEIPKGFGRCKNYDSEHNIPYINRCFHETSLCSLEFFILPKRLDISLQSLCPFFP